MKSTFRFSVLGAVLLSAVARGAEKPGIEWQPWSDDVFKRAAAEHKLVLLDLEAV